MFKGFKKFISRGNMIDMAVGVVMGAAVTSVVNSIVNSLINPLIAMIFGKPNMNNLLTFTFNHSTISFGAILGALLNFLMIAIAVYFCILVPINKFRDMSESIFKKKDDEDEKKEISTDQQTVDLLKEISAELKDIKSGNNGGKQIGDTDGSQAAHNKEKEANGNQAE
ncbi:large conductance mechanosensitive channel protein MscL [Bifidobacterium sp. ESL0690]|uniref:large conductance mechanosensitive channel protein MscL n=1 Tax=Bifidobacterium sp. ESL0690 TaxID=2983214 RepID=UPI0023F8B8CD|nr:large conductance mechanosensitive channel protein MscL [Bifidobacterium sp. ESL0690]WEV46757.1 large conductance mechanosensitive channel protein MscL [Bifidobacterium sp. ESL0690]